MKTVLEINGIEKSYPEGISDLENLLLFIIEKEKSEEELIVEVKVNGENYSEDYEHQAREVDLNAVQKIEVTTQTQEAFAQDFLKLAPGYVAQLEKGFGASVGLLRDPLKEEEGYDMLAKSLDALLAFKTHMDNVMVVLEKDDRAAEFKDLWERFGNAADRFVKAQEEEDIVLIADLIESEILSLLQEWGEKLSG